MPRDGAEIVLPMNQLPTDSLSGMVKEDEASFAKGILIEEAPAKDSGALATLAALFQSLNQQGIRYCHWKSNIRLYQSLQAKTDLDLLIDPKDQQAFLEILQAYNIKLVHSRRGKYYPEIENYLGFDSESGKIFHLHVHYQLVLGERFIKNHRLPLEEQFLASVRTVLGVKVPIPELEITVLSLRALLKYRDRDVVKDMLSIRSPGLPAPILEELHWLLKQTSMDRIAQTLSAIGEAVPADIVLEFLHTMQQTAKAGYKLYNLRRSARKALRPYQRYSRRRALAGTYRELWGKLPFIKGKEDKRMTRREGGLRIAFVGADGAGKSTIIKQTAKWMSWRLHVCTYYMGSNQPSAGTRVLKQASKIVNRAAAGCRRFMGKRNPFTALFESLSRFFESISFLGEGRDRYRRYQASLAEAKQGTIVLYDRYPLRGVHIFDRFMDGPRISSTYQGRMGKIVQKLAQIEEHTYQKISPPDHVVVLRVSPEVSLARKPDHKRELIEAKSQALDNLQEDGLDVTVIEADQPLDQVILQVKSAVWRLV